MDFIKQNIEDWFKEILVNWVGGNFEVLFASVNEQVGGIGDKIADTPLEWNGSIWAAISGISETAIVPIAALILTYVMCMELISIASDKNNMRSASDALQSVMHCILKLFIAVTIVSHTSELVIGFFELAQYAIAQSAGFVGEGNLDVGMSLEAVKEKLMEGTISDILQIWVTSLFSRLCLMVMNIIIQVVIMGRMISIYLYCSIGPIPFATFMNQTWSGIGQNYLKSLAALAFQGFFIYICLGIYAILIRDLSVSDELNTAILQIMLYSTALCFTIMKTGGLSNAIFSAH